MANRPNTPTPPLGALTTGLFRMKNHFASWRENGTPGWLLIYTLGGKGHFTQTNGELLTETGDLILLRPKVRHDYGLEVKLKRWDLLWAYFFPRTEWHSLLKWPEKLHGLLYLKLSNQDTRKKIVSEFMEVDRLNGGSLQQCEMFAMNALEKVLLLCNTINPRSSESSMDPRVLRALEYLHQNLSQPITLITLARHCGLSVSRLSHLFKKQVNQTPQYFLEIQRITRARQYLEFTQHPVSAIAFDVGFQDPFHFSHRFKHHLGVSPKTYRQNFLQSPDTYRQNRLRTK